MGRAYYNENDPFAAAVLRELIADDLIAPGDVDERSIADVRADDLAGYRQHHFFAGFGVWSAALRHAGWSDEATIWTASCPCPPFSSAGPNFRCPVCDTRSPVPNAVRTGAFDCIRCGHEWQADCRHLFPELFRLVRECRPGLVVGEQVASADGRTWLDIVSASLEMLGYAVGAPDTCAAGFGAPHIRQRLYWVADADQPGLEGWAGLSERAGQCASRANGMGRGLANPEQQRVRGEGSGPDESATRGMQGADGQRERLRVDDRAGDTALANRLDDATGARHNGTLGNAEGNPRDETRLRLSDAGLELGSLADSADIGHEWLWAARHRRTGPANDRRTDRPGPTNGLWRDADWLFCTDGKWRPVEPGTFPLADAGAFRNRVGALRGAGNAINIAQAGGFIEAVMDHLTASRSEAA